MPGVGLLSKQTLCQALRIAHCYMDTVVMTLGSDPQLPGFKSQHSHLLATHFTGPCLCFCVYKIVILPCEGINKDLI